MAEDWGDFFRNHQITSNQQNIHRILAEEISDTGEDNEDYVENMLRKEDTIVIAGLTNQLPFRTISLPWLLQVRHTAIFYIVHIGGCFGVTKITVYTAVIYGDRFLSSVPKTPRDGSGASRWTTDHSIIWRSLICNMQMIHLFFVKQGMSKC